MCIFASRVAMMKIIVVPQKAKSASAGGKL